MSVYAHDNGYPGQLHLKEYSKNRTYRVSAQLLLCLPPPTPALGDEECELMAADLPLDCNWYVLCLEEKLPCGNAGYTLAFAHPFCNTSLNSNEQFTKEVCMLLWQPSHTMYEHMHCICYCICRYIHKYVCLVQIVLLYEYYFVYSSQQAHDLQ